MLTNIQSKEIYSLTKKDLNSKKLKELFAVFYGKVSAKYYTNDKFILPKNTLHNNTDIETTVGRFIFNMFSLPEIYLKKFGYQNVVLNDDAIKGLESQMGIMILNDEMTTQEYATFMDNAEWLAMNIAYYNVPSLSNKFNIPIPEVIKRRDELFEIHKDLIEKGDPNIAGQIEKELLSMAKDKLEKENDPTYDYFKSGEFKFPVSYKKTAIMGGAIEDPQSKKIHILKSNYTDGVSRDEYEKFAQLSVIGGYSRGVSTQTYGYESKKYNSSLQNVTIKQETEEGKLFDCGTTMFLDIVIPKSLKSMFMYRYVLDAGKLVEITPDNISRFLDKPIKMRSPMFCKSDQICHYCAGNMFKRSSIDTPGLVASNLTGLNRILAGPAK